MTTTVTVKGQVTLPKSVRDAAGIAPGDRVEVHATGPGSVMVKKPGVSDYRTRALELAKRRIIRGVTTEEFMEMMRGESATFRPRKK